MSGTLKIIFNLADGFVSFLKYGTTDSRHILDTELDAAGSKLLSVNEYAELVVAHVSRGGDCSIADHSFFNERYAHIANPDASADLTGVRHWPVRLAVIDGAVVNLPPRNKDVVVIGYDQSGQVNFEGKPAILYSDIVGALHDIGYAQASAILAAWHTESLSHDDGTLSPDADRTFQKAFTDAIRERYHAMNQARKKQQLAAEPA